MPHTPNPFAPVESTSKPRRRDPKNTRERLVRAALDLFTTQGYHASTTPQVARRAGVAEGTIYRHFTSKEQLLNEIYRGAVRMFTQIVEQTPARSSCRDRMTDVADQWCEVASQDPPLVKLVFVTPPTGLLDEKSREAYEQMRVQLEKVVASGKASNEIRAGPAYLWTDVWLQLIRLLGRRRRSGEDPRNLPSRVGSGAQGGTIVTPRGFSPLPPATSLSTARHSPQACNLDIGPICLICKTDFRTRNAR
jgi:AcrR family transcriptional regulator